MSNFTVCMFVILWGTLACLNSSLTSEKVIAAVQDNGCTIPHEILDPILDKIVKERE